MKKMKMKKMKAMIIVFVTVFCLLAQVSYATSQCDFTASKGGMLDFERIAECMEDRYGFDQDAMRRFDKKQEAPTVMIHFDKTDPKVGEKVTAIAVPKAFKNTPEDLYFTWYLLREGSSDIEAAKELAMGIVARGQFDPELFGIDYTFETDDDGFFASYGGADGVGAKPVEEDSWLGVFEDVAANLCDVSEANIASGNFGKGVVRTSRITRCYRHNFGTKVYEGTMGVSNEDGDAGRDQVIECEHQFPSGCGTLGDGTFGLSEEQCWQLDPTNPDTDGDGVEDEADLVGLNQQQFSWKYREGDRVGAVIEGTSMIPIDEGCRGYDDALEGFNVAGPGGLETLLIPPGSNPEDILGDAYQVCREFLEDAVPMGDASAEGGDGGDDGEGGGGGSVDVSLEAALENFNTGVAAYEACLESIQEEWGRELNEDESEGELNAYYKIMWANTGICGHEDDSGESCEGSDRGFGYPYAQRINPQGRQILSPELGVVPDNPQYDAIGGGTDQDKSDVVTVSATTTNEDTDEDFLFYEWTVRKCLAGEDLVCSGIANVDFESFESGMGVKHLRFRPTESIFAPGEDKVTLQATLVQRMHSELIGGSDVDTRAFDVGAIERIEFPVVRNNVSLEIHTATLNGAGDGYVIGAEICNGAGGSSALYSDVCPVYDSQVIAVVANIHDPTATGQYAWQINGNPLTAPFENNYSGADNLNDTIFLPMMGYNKELQNISVTFKETGATAPTGGSIADNISGRKLSLNNPLAVIRADNGAVSPTQRADGTDSFDTFEAVPGATVQFRADIVPDYLTIHGPATGVEDLSAAGITLGENEVHLMWYLNGEFMENGSLPAGVVLGADSISFVIPPDAIFGTSYKVTARVEKPTSGVVPLEDTWKLLDSHTLINKTVATVRVTPPAGTFPLNPTLKEYLASSVSNAPYYLIFSIRLGIAMSLIWFVLFGFSYAIRLNRKL